MSPDDVLPRLSQNVILQCFYTIFYTHYPALNTVAVTTYLGHGPLREYDKSYGFLAWKNASKHIHIKFYILYFNAPENHSLHTQHKTVFTENYVSHTLGYLCKN